MALTYTFQMPGNTALRPVVVYNTAGTQQTSGTLDSNARFTAELEVGDYFARATSGRTTYEQAGTVDRGDEDAFGGSGGGGNGLPSAIQSKTSAYTAAAGDFVLANTTSAGFTVTLPTGPAVGALVSVKKVSADANTLTIAPAGGGNIDGDTDGATSHTQWAGAVFEHVGSNAWRVVASMSTTGPAGPQGEDGPQGEPGEQGEQGPSGGGGNGAFVMPPSGYWARTPEYSFAAVTVDPGTCYATPLTATREVSISRLAYNGTGGGTNGSTVHLGIYADNGSGQPGALLAECSTTAPGQNGGTQELAFTTPVALSQGENYWLALVHNGGATGSSVYGTNANGVSWDFNVLASSGDGQKVCWTKTGVTGALPADFGTPTALGAWRPNILFKVA